MEVLAIVPARGGSKGLPNKNILNLCGHPLIAYSIVSGLITPEINRVICSTDSEDIARIARSYGAETPFIRPSKFAEDDSLDIDTFLHALNWLSENENYHPDIVVQLRPTSPIRFKSDLSKAINLLVENPEADSVRAISVPNTTPYKMWSMKNNKLTPILALKDNSEPYNTARQNLPEVWAQTGAIDVVRSKVILNKKSMSGDNIFGIKVAEETYVDIDTINSFLLAELLVRKLKCIKPEL